MSDETVFEPMPEPSNALHTAASQAAGWAERNPNAPGASGITSLWDGYEEGGFQDDSYARSICRAAWGDRF